MQDSFEIASSIGSYPVTIGSGLLDDVFAQHPDAFYLIDEIFEDRVKAFTQRYIPVEAAETSKSLEAMPEIIGALRKLGATRSAYVVAIGGGTIQDVATFAVSMYMRGLAWTFMPTTLLSMADSCIGGKSAINAAGYKNLVGNFYPPKDVVIDTDFITTLDQEMVVGGLYEAAKICYARGDEAFSDYLSKGPRRDLSIEDAGEAVHAALLSKKWFIEIDEFDQNERLLLNYGHTFGHAMEAGTEFGVSHGIAVGIGMLISLEYVRQDGTLSADGERRITRLRDHIHELLGLNATPTISSPPRIPLDIVMTKFEFDKKHRPDAYRMVIPREDGSLALVSEPKTEATRDRIAKAYMLALDSIGWSYDPI